MSGAEGRTPVKLRPPRGGMSSAMIGAVGEAAHRRGDVDRVYLVSATYEPFDGTGPVQEELHVVLDDPPVESAPQEAYAEFLRDIRMPTEESVIYTFTPRYLVRAVADAGRLLWSRDAL